MYIYFINTSIYFQQSDHLQSMMMKNNFQFSCRLCYVIVESVDEMMKNHKVEIQKNIEHLCDSDKSPACSRFVAENLNHVADMLKYNFEIDQICQQLRMCTADEDVYDYLGYEKDISTKTIIL